MHLKQHVDGPTHIRGYTLHLLISDSAPINSKGVSAHKAIFQNLPIKSIYSKPKRQIRFKNLKNINSASLNLCIQKLSFVTNFLSINDSMDHYNNGLQDILDSQAPHLNPDIFVFQISPVVHRGELKNEDSWTYPWVQIHPLRTCCTQTSLSGPSRDLL